MATSSENTTPQTVDDGDSNVSENKYLVVAAIDFGTTYTGYAFSFRHDYKNVITSKFSGINVRADTTKAPTIVLLTPEKKFLAFGYEAEERYQELFEDGEADPYYYFERFKMKLYETQKLKLDTTISDKGGKSMPAIDVFAVVIEHLKEKLEQELVNVYAGAQTDDILWVITVPAIWSDGAKQFMRKSANKIGIRDDNLKLVLEPEAASLYCNSQKTCKTAKLDGRIELEHFPEGQKYIVADLGGGTADLSVHEILPDGNLKEIRRADGDAFGGNLVDMAFGDFLKSIFDQDVYEYITIHHYDLVTFIQHEFETKKRKFSSKSTEPFRFKIPKVTLTQITNKVTGVTFDDKIKMAKELYGDEIEFKNDKMIISPELMKTFFTVAVDGISKHIQKLRDDDELREINTLLMVGGFSESVYVKEMIEKNVPGLRIIVPVEPSLSVLKGAVIMGHKPKTITERIARFTYGFSCGRKFNPSTDPEELKVKQGDRELCQCVFDKVIERGQVLKYGERFRKSSIFNCTEPEDRFGIPLAMLYKSTNPDPPYATEDYDCEPVGIIQLLPPIPYGWPPFTLFLKELVFGESEMTVVAHNVNTGEKIEGKIDFL